MNYFGEIIDASMKRRQLSMFDPVSIDSYFEYWIIWRFEFWCNALVEGWTHGLQVDIGTSGRNEDDHALLSGWLSNDALFAGWYSSQCAVTRGWSRWTGCSSLYEYHIGRQAAASISRCCSVEKVDVLAVVRLLVVDCLQLSQAAVVLRVFRRAL